MFDVFSVDIEEYVGSIVANLIKGGVTEVSNVGTIESESPICIVEYSLNNSSALSNLFLILLISVCVYTKPLKLST